MAVHMQVTVSVGAPRLRRFAVASGMTVLTTAALAIGVPLRVAPVLASSCYQAVDDKVTVTEDSYTFIQPLDNDVCSAGAAVLSDVYNPHFGTITQDPDPRNREVGWWYRPPSDYSGTDDNGYRATDNGVDYSSATVYYTILPVNDQPSFGSAVPGPAGTEDTPGGPISFVASPGPPNESGQTLSATLTSSLIASSSSYESSVPVRGVWLSWLPKPNACGTAPGTVTLKDNGGTANGGIDQATVSVTVTIACVNDAPVSNNDSYTTPGAPLVVSTAKGVLANDHDVDGDTLTASVTSPTSHGTLSVAPNGSFSYSPTPGYLGADGFDYTASDGTLGDAAHVSIVVTAAGATPTAPAPTAVVTPSDGPAATQAADSSADPLASPADTSTPTAAQETDEVAPSPSEQPISSAIPAASSEPTGNPLWLPLTIALVVIAVLSAVLASNAWRARRKSPPPA